MAADRPPSETALGDADGPLGAADVRPDHEAPDAGPGVPPAGPDAPLTNERVGLLFHEIADVLEITGELPFKVGAYRRAADSIAHSPTDVLAAYRAGRPPRLEGVGKAISDKLAELATTGRMGYHERLVATVPPSLVTLLRVPGIGPRTAGELWRSLGIATLADLELAAREGRLRDVKGISKRTEERILSGLAELESRPPVRLHMAEARELADRFGAILELLPGVRSVSAAGSIRRGRETAGDLDLLVETDDPTTVLADVQRAPGVERAVAGVRGGGYRTSVQLLRGPQVDVMTMPPGRAGTYLVHFTGSAAHNVRLRERARDLGWSLSEHGFARLGPDGEVIAGPDAELRTYASEEEVYHVLGLPLIEPELREDRGEIEAALGGGLPGLVSLEDLKGDCHSHSEWSDGKESVETVAETSRRRGYAYQVLTDHSWSLTIANGLSPQQVEQQHRLIGELNERFAREEAAGGSPEGADPTGFRLLHGCELEIRVDGHLDYDDALLARYDVVVASLHVGRRQPRAQLMARYETALRSPHVDIIAHPSGRKIDQRPDLDLDWDRFYALAAETGTLLEVNGSDERLDLDDRRVRAALDAGCRFVIDSDAHYLSEWDNLRWGTAIARRGWLEPSHVANTLPRDAFLALMTEKPHRV
jgi:DNA polymerase (family 10)